MVRFTAVPTSSPYPLSPGSELGRPGMSRSPGLAERYRGRGTLPPPQHNDLFSIQTTARLVKSLHQFRLLGQLRAHSL